MHLFSNSALLLLVLQSTRGLCPSAITTFASRSFFKLGSSTSVRLQMTNTEGLGLSDIGSSTNLKNDSTAGITSWKEKIDISIAKSRKIRGGNYIQIATVDPITLEPRCRTVVFRGFLKTENNQNQIAMKMITDKRSNKFSEVTNSVRPIAEVVWWFAKSSEQYRIRGELKFIGVDEVDPSLITSRKEMWGNLSDPAREQFFWKDPGLPFESDSIVPVGGRDDEGKVLPPPDNFLMMLLIPQSCDYLRLGDNYRQMDLVDNGVWSTKRVNP